MNDNIPIALTFLIVISVSSLIGFSLGKDKGYDQALAGIKAITPAPKTTDQQCVAWLFETNMRAVKNRICK